jgi:anticodon-binding protein
MKVRCAASSASILESSSAASPDAAPTLERLRELRAGANRVLDKEAAKAILRELKAVGGNLRAVRRALTGCDSGPELWAVLAALPREETIRRIDAAL